MQTAADLRLPGGGISAKVPQLSETERDTEVEPRQEPETAKHQRNGKENRERTEVERGRRGRTEGEKKGRPRSGE